MNELKHPIPKRRGTALLFAEHPVVIDPLLAALLGLHEAIVLQQVHYWLSRNQRNPKSIKEGRVWVYNTYKDWKRDLIFMSETQIQRAFLSLEKQAVVIAKKFGREDWDQKKWYTIDYLALDKLQVPDFSDNANLHDRTCISAPSNMQNRTIESANLHNLYLITETTTETNTETTTTAVAVDHLLEKLPRELQLDGEVRSWLADSLATHGDDYTASNISATIAQSTRSPKAFLRRALREDWGHLYRAKKQASKEKAQQAARHENLEKARDETETLELQKARMIFEGLPAQVREEILAEARRKISPITMPQMIEATAFDIVMENHMSTGKVAESF